MLQALYSRVRSAPGVTAALLLLLVIAVVFWRSEPRPTTHVARLKNLQAKLNDGDCEFTADIELSGTLGRVAFGMRETTVRSTLVALMRSKSRYMVRTSTARESLRYEMLAAVNGVIGSGRATAVRLPRFEVL
jgi:flagellar basal body-associated protein FliL